MASLGIRICPVPNNRRNCLLGRTGGASLGIRICLVPNNRRNWGMSADVTCVRCYQRMSCVVKKCKMVPRDVKSVTCLQRVSRGLRWCRRCQMLPVGVKCCQEIRWCHRDVKSVTYYQRISCAVKRCKMVPKMPGVSQASWWCQMLSRGVRRCQGCQECHVLPVSVKCSQEV